MPKTSGLRNKKEKRLGKNWGEETSGRIISVPNQHNGSSVFIAGEEATALFSFLYKKKQRRK